MAIRRKERESVLDLGVIVIALCVLPLVAVTVALLAGYPVPRWIVAAVLSLCLVAALVLGLRFARRP